MITYRKAVLSDANELARLRSIFLCEVTQSDSEALRAENERANLAYFQKALADDSFAAWLAMDGDAIVGTSGVSFYISPPSFHCTDGRKAYIMNMYTLPAYRKRGIAAELFDRIVAEAVSRGYQQINLNATTMGKPLYERYGFKDVIGDMTYFANGTRV